MSYTGNINCAGRMFEYEFCGDVANTNYDNIEYKPWRKSIKEIITKFSKDPEKNPNNWDISDPDGVCSDLFYYVATALNVNNMEELQVYPAFGSAFDIFHGVDIFFIYNSQICTVDLTCKCYKTSYKAHVLVSETDVDNNRLEEVAKIIADNLCN